MTPHLVAAAGLVDVHDSGVLNPDRRALFVTSMWPTAERPHYGPFVESQRRSLELLGVAVDVIAIRGYESVLAYAAARRVIMERLRTHRPDVVHIHTGHAAVVGLPGIEAPTVLSFVGGDLLGHPNGHGVTRKSQVEVQLFRRLAGWAGATITKSREMEMALPVRLRAANRVIPNGVDLDRFMPVPREGARAALGWDPTEAVALFVGDQDDPRKNFKLARDSAALVRRRGTALRLRGAWGVHPEQIAAMMSAANVLVFTSLSEGSPNVIKEAMACALPIVATGVGDISERLEGLDACYVTPPTPVAFASALQQAVAGPRAYGARESVKELGLMRVAERVRTVYEDVIAARQDSSLGGALGSRFGG